MIADDAACAARELLILSFDDALHVRVERLARRCSSDVSSGSSFSTAMTWPSAAASTGCPYA